MRNGGSVLALAAGNGSTCVSFVGPAGPFQRSDCVSRACGGGAPSGHVLPTDVESPFDSDQPSADRLPYDGAGTWACSDERTARCTALKTARSSLNFTSAFAGCTLTSNNEGSIVTLMMLIGRLPTMRSEW